MSYLGDTLRRDGIVRIPKYCRTHVVRRAREYLATKPVYNSHVKVQSDQVPMPLDDAMIHHPVLCHDMSDVMNAPGLLEYALQQVDLVKEYLGPDPVLYSINAFHTMPIGNGIKGDIQAYHRDADDEKFLALFLFGSTVDTRAEGAHLYMAGTHLGPEQGEEREITGQSGTAFIMDGRGMHYGVKPKSLPRMLIWFRFGVSDLPASYVWDKLEPGHLEDRSLLNDEGTRRMLRLVAQ